MNGHFYIPLGDYNVRVQRRWPAVWTRKIWGGFLGGEILKEELNLDGANQGLSSWEKKLEEKSRNKNEFKRENLVRGEDRLFFFFFQNKIKTSAYMNLQIKNDLLSNLLCVREHFWASLVAQLIKNSPEMHETCIWSLGWEDTLEKGKATHSSILAWRILWTQSIGLQRVRHDWVTFTSLHEPF